VFTGNREGYFQAFDARDGKLLWKASLGGCIAAGPVTYSAEGKQYVAVAVAQALMPAAPRLIGALGRRPPERVPMSRGCPLGPAE
jgi:hypothetical protein